MAVFTYLATEPTGRRVRGSVIADTPRSARENLRHRGLRVVRVRMSSSDTKHRRAAWPWPAKRLPASASTQVLSELASLLSVGVPLLEALDCVTLQHTGEFKRMLLRVRDRVNAGAALSAAIAAEPAAFDTLCVRLVAVGERTGEVDVTIDHFATYWRQSRRWRSRVVGALLYPAMVLATGIGVSVFLMTVVVPDLLAALEHTGRPLPAATRVVQATSVFLTHWWWLLLAGAAALVAAATALTRREGVRHRLQLLLFGLPVAGDITRSQLAARTAMIVSILLRSGIRLDDALADAAAATSNLPLRRSLEDSVTSVRRGGNAADVMAEAATRGILPPAVAKVFTVGQESGRLGELLDKLSSEYDEQAQVAVSRLTTLLEPVITLLLAAAVGLIAFATLLPILELGDVL